MRWIVIIGFISAILFSERVIAKVPWDTINVHCSFAITLSEAIATAEVTVSQWRRIQSREDALDLLNSALREANRHCTSPGHEVRNPYNQIVPVRWGNVIVYTERRKQLVNATIRPNGKATAEYSNLSPADALVAAVDKQAAAEDEAQRQEAQREAQKEEQRREAEQREAQRKAQQQQQAELRARQEAEREQRKQAALKDCGAEPLIKGGHGALIFHRPINLLYKIRSGI